MWNIFYVSEIFILIIWQYVSIYLLEEFVLTNKTSMMGLKVTFTIVLKKAFIYKLVNTSFFHRIDD